LVKVREDGMMWVMCYANCVLCSDEMHLHFSWHFNNHLCCSGVFFRAIIHEPAENPLFPVNTWVCFRCGQRMLADMSVKKSLITYMLLLSFVLLPNMIGFRL
jgi:hypothetical protein